MTGYARKKKLRNRSVRRAANPELYVTPSRRSRLRKRRRFMQNLGVHDLQMSQLDSL